MRYTVDLAIAANTASTSPASTEVAIAPGTLVQCVVQFPPGPAGLAGIRILRWGRQIIPALGETWLTGDDTVLDIPERLGVMDSPHTLTVAGYNDDDLYPHTVTIHLDVLPVDRGSAQQGGGMLGRLRDALGL